MDQQSSAKRKDPESDTSPSDGALVIKKQRTDELALAPSDRGRGALVMGGIPRTSNLASPIMLLTGHKGEVYSMKFSSSGKRLVSGSFDKMIYCWNVFGECENYMVLKGHQNAVLEVHWAADESLIYSASADKTIAVWDHQTGQRIKKFVGHSSYVNSCCPSKRTYAKIVASGGDDSAVKLWDLRMKRCVHSFENKFPVTSVCFSEQGDQIFSGGLDNDIKVWDIRKTENILYKMEGHEDTVTGLRLSPDGSYLLSNSMDNSVRIWDIKPFVAGHRNIKIFQGVQHNFEKTLLKCSWSPDGSKISAGSADRYVNIWETSSRRLLYKLPGHKGSVNEVDFHPNEPIIGSCSSDKTIYLGEIKPT